jgi:multicomponent Na+:H+ antiporter subunit D
VSLISLSFGLPWLLGAAFAILDGRRPVVGWLSVAGLTASFVALCVLAAQILREGPIEFVPGGWPVAVGITLRVDALGITFALISCGVVLAALAYEVLGGVHSRTFPALALFVAAGLIGLFMTGDIFNFYVFFEIAMAAAYVLTGYREQPLQIRAAFIFAVVNLIGSLIFLIAVAALYRVTGSLDMVVVAERVSGAELNPTVMIALALFVAFGLKLGLFPFHYWLPTVYAGSHAAVAAILSGALANIGSYGLLRFGADILPEQLRFGAAVLLVLGTTSIVYGAIQAVSRRSPVEVMAYSAIGQVGYIMIALAIGSIVASPVGYAAAVLYAVVNSLNKLLIFLSTGLRGPLVGAAFAIGAFSVAGVPPAAGFLGKLSLFRAGLEVGTIAGAAIVVALIFIGGAFSFVYSFQVYQRVYLSPDGQGAAKPSPLASRVLVIAIAAVVVALGVYPEPLIFLSESAAGALRVVP